MASTNARERDVERRLGRVESPAPPADLLDRIRGDIPHHLRPADEPPATGRGRRYRLLAASVLLAVAGGLLAWRVFQTAPQPAARMAPAPVPAPAAAPPTTRPAPPAEPSEGAPVARRVPIPDPLPDDAEAAVEEESAALRERLRSVSELPIAPVVAAAPGAGQPPAAPEPEPRQEATAEAVPAPRPAETLASPGPPGQAADSSVAPPPSVREKAVRQVAPGRRLRVADERQRRLEVVPPSRPAPPPGPSTGGTAEPNDQPWGDMFFRSYGTNPFVDTEDDPLSTFGLDVDTGSYTLARGYLERGHLPPPEAIRVEEFLNYFDYDDPAPRRGDFSLSAEVAPSPWRRGPRYQLLRIGLRGREIPPGERRDATLVFVVDVSGSMERQDRIGLVRRSLHLLLDQLGPRDRVGLVTYGDRGRVVLEPTADLAAVRRAVDGLRTGGSTNAEEGLVLGYELARRHLRPGSIHRLVLCSDGVANVGRTGPESILARIGREADEGIELTTVGFGLGNYNDVMMEQLADRGDGSYAYVDSFEEARRIFVDKVTGTLETIASDAKIQVAFDPRAVTRYRLLGYENRDVADHRFRDDTVDAGEIGAGHRVTALYEIKLAEDAPRGALAEVRLRYRSTARGRVVEESLEVRRSRIAGAWEAGSPSLRLAALAAELAEVLKRSYWAREIQPEELRQRARAVGRDFSGEPRVDELVRLAEQVADPSRWPLAAPE